ncbi:hypothetical protein ACJJTC_011553 [Scirpophaga incertulas]
MAEFSGGGIPPDISTCDIGANEECLASVASYSSESSSLVSDSDVKSLGFSIKGEKRPRHKERRSKGKRSKVFIKDSSLSIPLGQQDPSSQDSSILLGQNQSTNSEQTELNSIINVISGSVADTQTTQQSHVLSDRQPIGRQNYCASDKDSGGTTKKKRKAQAPIDLAHSEEDEEYLFAPYFKQNHIRSYPENAPGIIFPAYIE